MTPFEKLLVAHLVGDWILGQTHWEACNKGKNWRAAVTHAAKWTLLLIIGAWWAAGNSLTWTPVLAIYAMGALHAVIDRRGVTQWLIKAKEWLPWGYPYMEPGKPWEVPMWVVICVDQVLHILQVSLIASLL